MASRFSFVVFPLLLISFSWNLPRVLAIETGQQGGMVEGTLLKVMSLVHGDDGFLRFRAAETEEEKREAIAILEPLAFEGNLKAILIVAGFYSIENQSLEARRKSFELYRMGAEQGDALCQFMVGNKYEFGDGTNEDLDTAERWYRLSAAGGSEAARPALAILLAKVGKLDQAAPLLNQLAVEENLDTLIFLGDAAMFGDFGVKDFEKAAGYYRRAAEQNSGYAALRLGHLYYNGDLSVGKNSAEAYRWYSLARGFGETQISGRLGSLILFDNTGEGGSDEDRAMELFMEGSENFDKEAAMWLAFMYASSEYSYFDPEKGYLWACVSIELGSTDAETMRDECASSLDSGQIEIQQAAARDYLARMEKAAEQLL